tara:strand:+ start:43135 stop:43545 length:411 start_codon:yes stop_codon:yes gene_type:complete
MSNVIKVNFKNKKVLSKRKDSINNNRYNNRSLYSILIEAANTLRDWKKLKQNPNYLLMNKICELNIQALKSRIYNLELLSDLDNLEKEISLSKECLDYGLNEYQTKMVFKMEKSPEYIKENSDTVLFKLKSFLREI